MLHAPVPDGQPSSPASIHAQPSSALCVAPSTPTEPLATHDVVDGLAPTLDPIPGNDADETFVLPTVAADMSGACSFHVSIIGAVHSSASSADGSPAKSTLDHPPPRIFYASPITTPGGAPPQTHLQDGIQKPKKYTDGTV
jgi:hypothetical protein